MNKVMPIKIYNDANRFVVDWVLNTLCTYHCSYCHPMLHMGKNFFKDKVSDKEIVVNFLTKLKKELNGRPAHFFLTGGEPTISPVFETIIDFISDAGWHAHVNTNGTRSLEFWKEYAKKIFKVSVSYHPESVDEEIFEKVEYIGTQTNVGVFTLMYPPVWDKAEAAYERFKTMERVTLSASRVFKRDELTGQHSYEYSEQQLKWMDEHSEVIFRDNPARASLNDPPNHYGRNMALYEDGTVSDFNEIEFVNNRRNQFMGWQCEMGSSHIFINKDWQVFQATCSTAKEIATIETFETLSQGLQTCESDYCMCTADVMIPKHRMK
jgi:organic radical activating enzyme